MRHSGSFRHAITTPLRGRFVDIAAWLRELGLERYEQVFQDSQIEPEILAELTDEDFKELGIRSCPWTWCRSWAGGTSVAGRAALVHAATAGSMRVRSSRKGAMVSRVM
jgi:hypothetical protein